jgi:hypothetical protein
MIVTCRLNHAGELPETWLEPAAGLRADTRFPLTVGRSYVVYALALRGGQVRFFIQDDDELYSPMAYPALLFEVEDDRVSSWWHFRRTPENLDHDVIFAIREWACDDYFYDRLTDGNPEELRIFRNARQRLESEVHET